MTAYAYRCIDCGEFDTDQPFGNPAVVVPCEVCEQPAARSYASLAVAFKGDGWGKQPTWKPRHNPE
jgi:putative FmdB family regulatory protein